MSISELFDGMINRPAQQTQQAQIDPALQLAQLVGKPGAFAAYYGGQRNEAMANAGRNISDTLSGGQYSSGAKITPDQLPGLMSGKLAEILKGDTTDPKVQAQALQIAQAINPETAVKLSYQFGEQSKALTKSNQLVAQQQVQRSNLTALIDESDSSDAKKSGLKRVVAAGGFDSEPDKLYGLLNVERKVVEDVNGRKRYQDTGALLFPDVEGAPEERGQEMAADGRRRYIDDGSLVFPNVNDPEKADPSTLASAVTKIFDDGTVLQSDQSGKTRVINSEGTEVTGAERVTVLANAVSAKAELAGDRANAVATARASINKGTEYFDSAEKLKASVTLFDRGIDLLDSGAASGRLASMAPTIRAQSIALEQLQREMGLDVVGNTTFGSLSEAELELALETALPTNLSPADLRSWLVSKKEATNKLLGYYQNAALFLFNPENSMADWIEQQQAIEATVSDTAGEITPEQQTRLNELRAKQNGVN